MNNGNKHKLPDILTAKIISQYLRVSLRRVYELFQAKPEYGGIPNFDIGRSKRVYRDDFQRWISEQVKAKAAR